ncbi:MAG: cyanoexosortase A system-associated protein [Oscillatoriales cyanobacterium C42_A2020_001]|nr:cyanoexosortase A system-associated protein [Leptolyngbyaceae cyanobacterium C42_A2020_001]
MLKSSWQTVRMSILAFTFVGTLVVWAKLLTSPKADSTAQREKDTLQASVPLPGWQLINSEPITTNTEAKAGRRYRFQRDAVTLNAEQYYMASDGNVSRYLFVHSPIKTANASMKVKFKPDVGHYGLVSHNGNAYLSACINPRGSSTVTESQFTQNRYANDLQIARIAPWLLGQESLIDYRCLWTLMSIPLKNSSQSDAIAAESGAYQRLEDAWVSWHQWWQANFPPSR